MALNSPVNHYNDSAPILFVDFNQDLTSLVVGSQYGYSLFNTTNDKIEEVFTNSGEKICIMGRLFSSSLVTLVSMSDTRKLLVFHFRRNTLICHYRYSHTILAVKMNRQRLIVCVEDGIFIHNIRDMEMLHKVEETPPNRNGIVALSSSSDVSYLAYPGSHRAGTVFIFDAVQFKNVTSIAAHDGLLAALEFNSQGSLLATASEKGTVIRVFAIPGGSKVAEFRRGLARCALINNLSFSLDSQFLVAASNTETVHVFKTDLKVQEDPNSTHNANYPGGGGGAHAEHYPQDQRLRSNSEGEGDLADCCREAAPPSEQSGWWMDWMGSALKASASYLPTQVSEVLTQDRAFAFAKIGTASANMKKKAALVYMDRQPRLLVACQDGSLYIFAVDPVNGGEANLLKTHNLLNLSQSSIHQDSSRQSGNKDQDIDKETEAALRLNDEQEFPPVAAHNGKNHK